MTTTTTHLLPLKLGRVLRVEVTEAREAVYINIAGDKFRPSEMTAFKNFFWPIVNAFEEDDRVLELDSVHNRGPARRIYTLARIEGDVLLGLCDVPRPRAQA